MADKLYEGDVWVEKNLKGDMRSIFVEYTPTDSSQFLLYTCQNLDNTIKIFEI